MASPVAALAQTYDRGLLWRVSQAETPASYLYGTMHLADPRLLALPPAAEAAFDRARIFVLESGSPEMREISVGIQDLDFFEIADGEVEEGDLIIVGPADDAR